jgi:hypothetical protein
VWFRVHQVSSSESELCDLPEKALQNHTSSYRSGGSWFKAAIGTVLPLSIDLAHGGRQPKVLDRTSFDRLVGAREKRGWEREAEP